MATMVGSARPVTSLHAEVVSITPAMAERILADQQVFEQIDGTVMKQRKLDAHRVRQYAREMALGRWHLNGETIQFDGPRLLNGQHRLHAVVESGTTVPILVVRGVAAAAFTTIDQGKSRSIGDLLRQIGYPYRHEVAGAARTAMIIEQTSQPISFAFRPTRGQVVEYCEVYREELIEASALASALNLGHRVPMATLMFLAKRHPVERADFAQRLREGVGLDATDPARLLRERLIKDLNHSAKLPGEILLALGVKAWNAHYGGVPLKLLRFAVSETFPIIA